MVKNIPTLMVSLGISLMLAMDAYAGTTTYTRQNGRTTTSTVNRRPVGGQPLGVQRQTTFPSGQATSYNGSFTGSGNGAYTGTIDRLGVKGNSQTYQVNGQRLRNGNTVTNSGTITHQNGGSSTYDRTRTCLDKTCTGNSSYTGTQGNTYSNDFTTTCGNGVCNKNSIFTGPQGKNAAVNTSATRTGVGTYSGTRTTTGPKGNTGSGTFLRTP